MPDESTGKQKIRFDYLKSSQFRMVHVDGVIGGPTPKGSLFVAVWNERAPIPQQVVHEVERGSTESSGKLGEEVVAERLSRNAIIREAEVGMIMDLATAEQFYEWLGRHLETLRKIQRGGKND